MANKRIELEQYKYYVNLLEEEPNRKAVRSGVVTCMVVMSLLALGMFVLGIISTDLAKNPGNIIEKPQPEQTTPSTTVPGQEQIPGGTQIPGTQQLPSGIPESPTPTPSPSPGGKAPSGVAVALSDAGVVPAPLRAGELLAQAQVTVPAETPAGTTPAGTAPSTAPSTKKQEKPLPETTSGAGSLSKLTTSAGGRGLQIYFLVLAIGLIVLMYLATRKVRIEGRSK
jgi:hypothetical protein